jgi:hypothetical protein
MQCPRCLSDNPDTSRFCDNCAALLIPETSAARTRPLAIPVQRSDKGVLFSDTYMIEDEIGRGGMGVVLEAEDMKLKRPVASRDLLMPFVHVYTDLYVPELKRNPQFNDLLERMKLVD